MSELINDNNKIFKLGKNQSNEAKLKPSENFSLQKNIFTSSEKSFDKNNLDEELQSSEKFTAEKYGSEKFLSELNELDDISDDIEISERAETPLSKEPEKFSIDPASETKIKVERHTDKDGNEIFVREFTDASGKTFKTEKITVKIVKDDSLKKETVTETTDENGKLVSTTKSVTDLNSGEKSVSKILPGGDSTTEAYDKAGNLLSTTYNYTDGSTVGTIIEYPSGERESSTITYEPNGIEVREKSIFSAEGAQVYNSHIVKDPAHNKIDASSFILGVDENGNDSEIAETCTMDLQGNVISSTKDIYTYSEYTSNTAYPTSTMTMHHVSTDDEPFTVIQTTDLKTGDYDAEFLYENSMIKKYYTADCEVKKSFYVEKNDKGLIRREYDKDENPVSESRFIPDTSKISDSTVFGMSESMLINPEGKVSQNLPGEYIEITYDSSGNASITKDYKVDALGNVSRVNLSETEEIQRLAGIDSKIGPSNQRATGDCWALAGINSLSYSEKGRQILSDALEYDEKGATVHTYLGDYSVTYEDIEEAKKAVYTDEDGNVTGNKYSSGDTDVLVFELCLEQLRDDVDNFKYIVRKNDYNKDYDSYLIAMNIDSEDTLSGGRNSEVLYYLTGNQSSAAEEDDKKMILLDAFKTDPDNSAVGCSFKSDKVIKDADGNNIKLFTNHAYAVKSFDGETVTMSNPWNSGNDIVINIEDFIENTDIVEYTDLTELEKDKGLLDAESFFSSFIYNFIY